MMHLAANTAASGLGMLCARTHDGLAAVPRLGRRFESRNQGKSDFRSSFPNFLEMRRSVSHYSVIVFRCFDYRACRSPSTSSLACAGVRLPMRGHCRCGIASLECGRCQLRTGERKTYANGAGFAVERQVDITVSNVKMMRIAENIHATHPLSAAVAPTLCGRVLAIQATCGTTPSIGAADADGR